MTFKFTEKNIFHEYLFTLYIFKKCFILLYSIMLRICIFFKNLLKLISYEKHTVILELYLK